MAAVIEIAKREEDASILNDLLTGRLLSSEWKEKEIRTYNYMQLNVKTSRIQFA